MISVWGRRSAFNVQKVLWTLGELGLPCEHSEVGGAAGGLDTPGFLALNPNGVIPVLDDSGLVLWESQAIVRYLAAKYGAEGEAAGGKESLWPKDPGTRALADRWMDWSQSGLQPAFMDLFWGYYRTPPQDRDAAFVERAAAACAHYYQILDAHLARHDFVGGDHFTMGDIPVGTSLYRYFEMGSETPDVPAVRVWYGRLKGRSAFKAHIMQPFDDLQGRLSF